MIINPFNYNSTIRSRMENSANDLQKIFEINSTTIEEILSFPNVLNELQTKIETHGFFTNERVEFLISLMFKKSLLKRYQFDDGRKYALMASELLSVKIPSISAYFYQKNTENLRKTSGRVDELDIMDDFEIDSDSIIAIMTSSKLKNKETKQSLKNSSVEYLISMALRDGKLDEIRSGYLSKVLADLFQNDKNEFLGFFYKSNFDCNCFLQFFELYSISEFLTTVVLYENSLKIETMVFQEIKLPICFTNSPFRVRFLIKILINPQLTTSFEIGLNLNTFLKCFLSKVDDIKETDQVLDELFVKLSYFTFLKNALLNSKTTQICYEVLQIINKIVGFLVSSQNSKNEFLKAKIQAMFIENTSLANEFLELFDLIRSFFNHSNFSEFLSSKNQSKKNQKIGIKFEICIFGILEAFIQQSLVQIYHLFVDTKFITNFLVF